MWKGGTELEVETEWEIMKRYYEGDSKAPNPTNRQMLMMHTNFAAMHGITRDFSVRGKLPVQWAKLVENGKPDQSEWGLGDIEVSAAYRLDPLVIGQPWVFEGGAFPFYAYTTVSMPTAEKADRFGDISFGDETWGARFGLTSALSTTRYYVFSEISTDVHGRQNGTGKGQGFKGHIAYAYRLNELKDYREYDYILLAEGDIEYRDKGKLNGQRNPNSGYFKTHLALAFQVNITNLYEIKVGYNLPLYRKFFGRQFVHEGVFAIAFGAVF